MIKELSQEQINLALNSKSRLDKINGAQNILLQALNTMKNNSEVNNIEPQDIYPELWINLVSETIEIVDDMERTLAIKVKDIIKRTAISEKSNPIVKKINRVANEGNGLMTSYNFFKLRECKLFTDSEETIKNAITMCIDADTNEVYSTLHKSEAEMCEFLNGIEELTSAINATYIEKDVTQIVLDKISAEYNLFVAYDILFTIFVPDYIFALNLPIIKYGWITDMVQMQIIEEAKKNGDIPSDEESTEDEESPVEE